MKRQLLLLCLSITLQLGAIPLFSSPSYAQEQASTNSVKYQFAVQDVNDAASAKEMTDYIRPIFNTEDEPFGYFPWYNSTTRQFEFQSSVHVSETQLADVLQQYGLVLVSFSAAVTATANTFEK